MISEDRYGPDAWVRAWIRGVTRMIWRNVLIGATLWGIIYAAGRLRSVIASVILAAVLAYIIRPIATRLCRSRWFLPRIKQHARRGWATLGVVILLFVVAYFGVKTVLSPFVHEAKNLAQNYPNLQAKWNKTAEDARDWYTRVIPEGTRTWIEQQWAKPGEGGQFDVKARVTEWGQRIVQGVAGSLGNIVELVLLPVLAFYLALDSTKLKHEFVAILPSRRKEVLRVIHLFNQIMVSYVVGQAILCLLAGVVVGVGLWALHMDYWVTLGLLAGITRAIPIIGPIFGGIPIVLLALITKGFTVALWILAFFTFLHFAESKFIMPTIIGDRMQLHAVVIIIVLLIGGEFGGLLGMFFAPPLAAIIRVVIRRYWLQSHRHRQRPRILLPPGVERVPVE